MGQPTRTDIHLDTPLTNMSIAYMQSQNVYIATKVFPPVPVEKQSDKYFIFDKAAWFRDEAERRAPGTPSVGSGYTVSNSSYDCDVFGIHKDVAYQDEANADRVFNLRRSAMRFVTQRLLLRQEIQWAADYFTTSIWGTDRTVANLWSDYVNSDPIEDVETGKATILQNTGQEANRLVMAYDVFRRVRNHPDIIDRIKYTQTPNARTVTEAMLADMFGVEQVLVAKAVKNTANEGATASMSFVHGKHALLCYAANAPALEEPSAGYTFHWTGFTGPGTEVAIYTEPVPNSEADRIEGKLAFDHKVTGSDLGYFFGSVVA